MSTPFNLSQYRSYREDNRLEVKRAKGGCRPPFGRPIQPLPIAMVA